jgi:hypothetical protein
LKSFFFTYLAELTKVLIEKVLNLTFFMFFVFGENFMLFTNFPVTIEVFYRKFYFSIIFVKFLITFFHQNHKLTLLFSAIFSVLHQTLKQEKVFPMLILIAMLSTLSTLNSETVLDLNVVEQQRKKKKRRE